jgi:uncharacterized BrkB/YihY/UPF0761 family membrane protein
MIAPLLLVAGIGEGLFVIFFFLALSALICLVGARTPYPASEARHPRRRGTPHTRRQRTPARFHSLSHDCMHVCVLCPRFDVVLRSRSPFFLIGLFVSLFVVLFITLVPKGPRDTSGVPGVPCKCNTGILQCCTELPAH